MTKEQLASIQAGDRVRYDGRRGRIPQSAATWFMITWEDSDVPEIIKRQPSPFTEHLELDSV